MAEEAVAMREGTIFDYLAAFLRSFGIDAEQQRDGHVLMVRHNGQERRIRLEQGSYHPIMGVTLVYDSETGLDAPYHPGNRYPWKWDGEPPDDGS